MAKVELIMPKMGESIMEATILKWLKKPGDKIDQDESVLEVATDKVDTEVPSTYSGVLEEILAKEGEVVKVGKAIAILSTEKEESTEPVSAPVAPAKHEVAEKGTGKASHVLSNGAHHAPTDFKNSSRFYSPLVKNIAREENIPVAELETIAGTGAEGRVTKKDILNYVQIRRSAPEKQSMGGNVSTASSPTPKVHASVSSGDEIIEMDRMRRMIADRMVESKRISPHVTSFVEADVTNIVQWRNKVKNDFQKREGDVLTFTPIFIEAVVMAIKDFPMINIQVDGDKIIKKKDINIGLAVALPSGNLIVPVIRNADQYTIGGLAKLVNDLAKRARENKLKADELSGGTFTISNVGSFGNVMGTPIIMQPQVGIIALGAIQKKPAVMEMPFGDVIAIRHKMFLSHSYDHRVVDGALGGSVVRRVADYLEKFDVNRSI
jgi:2-oxoglutarate dehydrogenase E2 component (dihydrolipoamide succinyltransferase)